MWIDEVNEERWSEIERPIEGSSERPVKSAANSECSTAQDSKKILYWLLLDN